MVESTPLTFLPVQTDHSYPSSTNVDTNGVNDSSLPLATPSNVSPDTTAGQDWGGDGDGEETLMTPPSPERLSMVHGPTFDTPVTPDQESIQDLSDSELGVDGSDDGSDGGSDGGSESESEGSRIQQGEEGLGTNVQIDSGVEEGSSLEDQEDFERGVSTEGGYESDSSSTHHADIHPSSSPVTDAHGSSLTPQESLPDLKPDEFLPSLATCRSLPTQPPPRNVTPPPPHPPLPESCTSESEASIGGASTSGITQEIPVKPPKLLPRHPDRNSIRESQATPWQILIQPILISMQSLFKSARSSEKSKYITHSSHVVDSVRRMLHASHTSRKDSEYLKQHAILKATHRELLSSLSRLVVAAKDAGKLDPPDDSLKKMTGEGNRLLEATKEYARWGHELAIYIDDRAVKSAQRLVVELQHGTHPSTPFVTTRPPNMSTVQTMTDRSINENSTDSNTRPIPNYPLPPQPQHGSSRRDMVQPSPALNHAQIPSTATTSTITPIPGSPIPTTDDSVHIMRRLENLARKMRRRMADLMSDINTSALTLSDISDGLVPIDATTSPPKIINARTIVSETKLTVAQVGDFLQVVEDINVDIFSRVSRVLQDFRRDKLGLYNHIGGLVMATAKATDVNARVEQLYGLGTALSVVDKSIRELTGSVRVLLAERRRLEGEMRGNARSETRIRTQPPPAQPIPAPPPPPQVQPSTQPPSVPLPAQPAASQPHSDPIPIPQTSSHGYPPAHIQSPAQPLYRSPQDPGGRKTMGTPPTYSDMERTMLRMEDPIARPENVPSITTTTATTTAMTTTTTDMAHSQTATPPPASLQQQLPLEYMQYPQSAPTLSSGHTSGYFGYASTIGTHPTSVVTSGMDTYYDGSEPPSATVSTYTTMSHPNKVYDSAVASTSSFKTATFAPDLPHGSSTTSTVAITASPQHRPSMPSIDPLQSSPKPNHRPRAKSAPGTDMKLVDAIPQTPTASSENKLRKFFGEDSAIKDLQKMHLQKKGETVWYLVHDYQPSELIFNMEGQIKGGTIQALIERLGPHEDVDTTYALDFMLTYRNFLTSHELINQLMRRFSLQPPELDDEEMDVWIEKKLTPIRVRVFNILRHWIEIFSVRSEDQEVFEIVRQFAREVVRPQLPSAGVQLLKLLDKRESGAMRDITGRHSIDFRDVNISLDWAAGNNGISNSLTKSNSMNGTAPTPIISASVRKHWRKLKTIDLESLEIARQLSLIEFQLYSSIHYVECLDKAWSTAERNNEKSPSIYPLPPAEGSDPRKAVNVRRMIAMSNKVTSWVAQSILEEDDLRKRVTLTKHFISVADRCRSLNNFNTLMSILAGLDSAPIHRLARTWEMLPTKSHTTLNNLKRITHPTKNFSILREELHSAPLPCVPFLGVYLTDLTFIAEGNPDFLRIASPTPTQSNGPPLPAIQPSSKSSADSLINFSKHAKTAEVIKEILKFQSMPYTLKPVPEIQEYLLKSIANSRDGSELYDMSLVCEPREREDEKLVRLLHESGLL